MFRSVLLALVCLATHTLHGQGYSNWFLGNGTDAEVNALGGSCLMGGATEQDEAMRWFLQRANGGDVLVLRASGSDGYQTYFYSELGVSVNSVETIRFDGTQAATSSYVHERIQRAEAIWFAGGDQWNYVNYWRGTAIDSLINEAIEQRNIVIGGTSAGLAILGGVYFTAQNGSITSAAALADPYSATMTVSAQPFLQVPYMATVITDSHYDDPDRRGRHVAFMARGAADTGGVVRGIGCNEYTAVCVDPDGQARVYGDWPDYEEHAYFIQANCLYPEGPEALQAGVPLTWWHDGVAVKACKVPGTMQGVNTFDLNDWTSMQGGEWQDWSVQQGVLSMVPGDAAPDCLTGVRPVSLAEGSLRFDAISRTYVLSEMNDLVGVEVLDVRGRKVAADVRRTSDGAVLNISGMSGALVLVRATGRSTATVWKVMVP